MELVPGLKRAGLLFDANNSGNLMDANSASTFAEGLGVSLHLYGVRNLDDVRSALARLDKDRIQTLFVWNTLLMLLHRQSIMEFASHKIPVISDSPEFAELGALVTYSANFIDMWRRASAYVDKILKGAKPADLPIEQPTKFQMIINLRAAKALRITIPESIVLQADEILR